MAVPTVLIVEDEAIVALDMKHQLTKLGYQVVAVTGSGDQAVGLAGQHQPDIVLMDVRLQGKIDGIQAAEAIRRDHDIPIIFLTSHSDDDTVQRAARTAPYGYLTKPYQLKELRAGIEVALTKAGMERRLREADQWFAHTLRCVADGVILTDLEGRIRFVNPAAEKLTGWGFDDAAGQVIGDIVCFRDAAQAGPEASDSAALVRRALHDGRPVPVAHGLSLVARGGTDTLVDQTAGPVDDGQGHRLGAVLVLRDATERTTQEALLRASEERFRGAFDHAPLGMALVSLSGEFLQVNAALCRLLGVDAAWLKLTPHASLTVDADRDHESRRLQELMTSPQGVVQFERHYRRPDGAAPLPALVSASLMHQDEQVTCYLYQVQDLTEQREAAEHLAALASERMKREASELASKAKSEFLSRASHEMRTPLNAVIGFAQLLEYQKGSDPQKALTYAKHIRTAGEHLLQLVTDLLDLNSTGQGALKMRLQPVDLAGVVREAIDLLAPLSSAHGVVVEPAVRPGLLAVADPIRLRQVLLNLGSNSVKYNRQGGRVVFETRQLPDGRVRLTVEDTGIGMTGEQMERLFQPFERLGLERTQIPGVGLGLVIAKGLVSEMGGELSVTSEPRQGTVVIVDLRAAP